MSYAKYLNDLMHLWAGWSKSRYMRKYLYMSLGLVVLVGVVIGLVIGYTIHGAASPLGVPVAFLLISTYDWLRRRKQMQPRPGYGQGWKDTVATSTEAVADIEDEDHPEEYDDLDGDEEDNLEDLECDCGHDHSEDETH
jgi:hypothetical protein